MLTTKGDTPFKSKAANYFHTLTSLATMKLSVDQRWYNIVGTTMYDERLRKGLIEVMSSTKDATREIRELKEPSIVSLPSALNILGIWTEISRLDSTLLKDRRQNIFPSVMTWIRFCYEQVRTNFC
jgi:hypothetical protein